HLAVRSGQPIVPVVIAGTHAILPKGSLRVRPGRVVVSIHRPIDTAFLTKADKHVLMDTVRSMMIRGLERLKALEAQSDRSGVTPAFLDNLSPGVSAHLTLTGTPPARSGSRDAAPTERAGIFPFLFGLARSPWNHGRRER
ncbi:MAG: hypothetical protein JRI36_14170, partial [Deltaproteobacteria bacterium]|nr:hypothetical protein [Deltaproteobacteria bacterium]